MDRAATISSAGRLDELRGILRKYWGYESFRPLQAEAMSAVAAGRDSVVVLPTGGGKSLCFQAPALAMPGLAVVVSPLISLMKDQIDALLDCGVPAAAINSSLSAHEKQQVADDIRGDRLKLLYLSPERLMTERTLQFLQGVVPAYFAIDEAHCISEWGHDFRPEYRMLRQLKEIFPETAVHAYTATATEHVRGDIARELQLSDPAILVGSFDRPNLAYRVQRRGDVLAQVRDVIDRHRDDSGIIYCIRRADVEGMSATLAGLGYQALPYHAGLDADVRRRNQDAFINDRCRIIVATVAFGMGIDKSDVRYVIHAAAPKSLEAYQQESGRAGRDGLEAECWLFYSAVDFGTWRKLQADLPPEAHHIAMTVLAGIERFCTGVNCRHAALVEYFGQTLGAEGCNACDVCLEELDLVEDALILAQKILSCVVRLKEGFGADYTALVLAGSREARILQNGHEQLSTWNILGEHDKQHIRGWIEQLVAQGFLKKDGEYNLLQVTPEGWRILRGESTPRLLRPAKRGRQRSKGDRESWEGVDRDLFEALRVYRRRKAEERAQAPFVIFSDATLRELARRRPTSAARLLDVPGIGDKKCADFGDDVIDLIAEHCRESGTETDVDSQAVRPSREPAEKRLPSPIKLRALAMFAEGKSIDEVRRQTERAVSTLVGYLLEHIEAGEVADPSPWLERRRFERIAKAADEVGGDRLKPIFDALGGEIGYDEIRIAVACLRNALGS